MTCRVATTCCALCVSYGGSAGASAARCLVSTGVPMGEWDGGAAVPSVCVAGMGQQLCCSCGPGATAVIGDGLCAVLWLARGVARGGMQPHRQCAGLPEV